MSNTLNNGSDAQWFSNSATSNFGDLHRFDAKLDHYGVGQILEEDQPYQQDPDIANNMHDWHADFNDPDLGFFAAKVAITQRVMAARVLAQASGGYVKSIQLPADTVGDFTVLQTPSTDRVFHSEDHIKQCIPGLHTTIAADITYLGLSTEVTHDSQFGLVQTQQHSKQNLIQRTVPYIHIDQPNLAVPGLLYLGSNTLTTVGPQGVIYHSMLKDHSISSRVNNPRQLYFSNFDSKCDTDSVKELAEPGKIVRLTGWDMHAVTYGDFAGQYFKGTTDCLERVFAFMLCPRIMPPTPTVD